MQVYDSWLMNSVLRVQVPSMKTNPWFGPNQDGSGYSRTK